MQETLIKETKRKEKHNKGITLIALVVTIIILLILAGVAISTLTGENGIINRTATSKVKTEETGIQEELQTAIEALKIDYYSNPNTGTIGDYIVAHSSDLQKAVGEKNTIIVNGNRITYKDLKFTIDIQTGKIIGKTPTGGTVSWSAIEKNGETVITDGTNELKVGDYVNYNPTLNATTGLTYTSYSVQSATGHPERNEGRTSGHTSDQTFDAQNYANAGYRWRVLDIKNGNIRLISEEPFGPGNFEPSNKKTYCLCGREGFLYGIDELKAICAIFGHGKGAESSTSITADDILSITGYDLSSQDYGAGDWGESNSTVTYTRGDGDALSSVFADRNGNNNKNLSWSGNVETFNYYNGTTFIPLTSGNSIPITCTYYDYDFKKDPSINHSLVDSNGMFIPQYELLFGKHQFNNYYSENQNFGEKTTPTYFVPNLTARSLYDYVDYSITYVYGTHLLGYRLIYSDGYETASWCYVRPVVSLLSSVQLEWNSTRGEWEIQ